MIDSPVRAAEGHQLEIRIFRLRADGTRFDAKAEEKNTIMVGGGSPSMPAEAPFGMVHLGEKFASNLVIKNEGVRLTQLFLKVELQTSTHRSTLTELTSDDLEAGQLLQCKLAHEIREIGVHVIVCSFHYINPITNEKKFTRKFFRFSVVNPLMLKTKVTELKGLLLLEAQIQNVSNSIFTLDCVRFEPVEGILCNTIKVLTKNPVDCFGFESLVIEDALINKVTKDPQYGGEQLSPEGMHQYVFVVRCEALQPVDVALELGRLDIKWRSEADEQGRLQTGILSHQWEHSNDITVSVLNVPSKCLLYEPFDTLFIIQNRTRTDLLDVRLIWDMPQGFDNEGTGYDLYDPSITFAPCGAVEIRLGTLTALNSTRTRMRLVPLKIGLVESEYFHVQYIIDGSCSSPKRIPVKFTSLIETSSPQPFNKSDQTL